MTIVAPPMGDTIEAVVSTPWVANSQANEQRHFFCLQPGLKM